MPLKHTYDKNVPAGQLFCDKNLTQIALSIIIV